MPQSWLEYKNMRRSCGLINAAVAAATLATVINGQSESPLRLMNSDACVVFCKDELMPELKK